MIRQARTYLVGAMSGTVLIGAAIAVFVVLVSAQVFRDWPVASLGSGGPDEVKVSDAKSASASTSAADAGGAPAAKAAPTIATPATGRAPAGGNAGNRAVDRATATAPQVESAAPDTTAGPGNPISVDPETPSGSPESSDGSPAGKPSTPAAPAPSSPPPSSGGNGGGNASPSNARGSGGSPGNGVQLPSTKNVTEPVTKSPSKTVTESVNSTVNGVDEATGGTVGETGVPKAAEEVVNGVAGPESPVGHTVDEVGNVVGGLPGGGN